jgi:hypothetical protein
MILMYRDIVDPSLTTADDCGHRGGVMNYMEVSYTPMARWLIMDHPMKMNGLGVSPISENPYYIYLCFR